MYRKLFSFFLILAMLVSLTPAVYGADALSRVTFFGDSTTAHLAVRGGVPRSRVWSGAASTVLFESVNKQKCVHLSSEGLDLTLYEAVKRKKPEILVITVGVSGGAGVLPRERFVETYRTMLSSVKRANPETKLLVQSILPLSDRSVKHYKHLTKASVTEANRWIQALCAEMNIPYLDTHSALCDPETGYLKAEYQNDEYMHLTKAAYAVVLQTIREKLTALGY